MKPNICFYVVPALFILLSAFIAPANWITFKKSGYQIAFPGNPVADSSNDKTGTQKYRFNSYTYQNIDNIADSNLIYQLNITTYLIKLPPVTDKAGVKKILDNGTKGGLGNIDGKLLSEKEISVGNYPGREIRLSIEEGQGVVTSRLILVGQRLFFLLTAADAGKENNADVSHFFNSFVVK